MSKKYTNINTNPDGFSKEGIYLRQNGRQTEFNPGEEKVCKYCGSDIVWLVSKKGKYYPVDFYGGFPVVYSGAFHKCIKKEGI